MEDPYKKIVDTQMNLYWDAIDRGMRPAILYRGRKIGREMIAPGAISVGVDFAWKPKWWQRILGIFFKKHRPDKSCMVMYERVGDEIRIIDTKYF